MLKSNEKRTLLIVILGVSLVSLVAALISGIISGLMLLVNGEMLRYTSTDHFETVYGLFLFVGMGLGVAYLVLYLVKKNYRSKIVLGLLIAQAAYFTLTALCLYIWSSIDQHWDFFSVDFSYLESYVAALLTTLVSSVLITVSSHFLHKSNQKEESNQADENSEEN